MDWKEFKQKVQELVKRAEELGLKVQAVDYDTDLNITSVIGDRVPEIIYLTLSIELKVSTEPGSD